MIWPFAFVVLSGFFGRRSIYKEYKEAHGFLGYLGVTGFLVLFSTVVFFVGMLFALLVGLAVPKQWTESDTIKLVSLRDIDGVSGHLFLGSGSIGTTQYYFFYKEAGEGYQPGKVAVDGSNVTVFEEERQDGQLKVYTWRFKNPSFSLWLAQALSPFPHKYEFFIPKGSLTKSFVLQ